MKVEDTWTEKYRPKQLEDIILSEDNRRYFATIKGVTNNYLFLGKSGTGKNCLAYYLRDRFAPESTLYLNASAESGIDVVRNKITDFISTVSWDGKNKLVILSEFDGFSKAGQDALREIMEQHLEDVRFILTANHRNKITDAIKSRCQTFEFTLDIKEVAKRVVSILKAENISNWASFKPEINTLIKKHYPDIRVTLNELQKNCVTGQFHPVATQDSGFTEKVIEMLKNKKNIFEIRKYVIDNDMEYGNDFHSLMRKMFDAYIGEENLGASLLIAEHMAKHNQVMDTEVNFSGLLFNLANL